MLGIEHRGWDSTGFAFRDSTGALQVHKAPSPAREFVKKRLCLPKSTRTAIIHTRFATQGEAMWNDNNHPILTGNIVGVHNGHIYNDDKVFDEIKAQLGRSVRIAQVDSEAIFAALNYYDEADVRDVLESICGAAAVAWLDKNDEPDVLHLARASTSPLIIAETEGGSLLFASEKEVLYEAFVKFPQLVPKTIRAIEEGTLLTVVGGYIETVNSFTPSNYRYYGCATNSQSYGAYGSWADDQYDWDSKVVSTRTTTDDAEYAAWLRNSTVVGELVEQDGPDWNLSSYYLTQPMSRVPLMEADEYGQTYKQRLEEIVAWTGLFRGTPGVFNKVAESLKVFARPGATVETIVQGYLCRGQIAAMPNSFPGGEYLLRVCLPKVTKSSTTEFAYVARNSWEFELVHPDQAIDVSSFEGPKHTDLVVVRNVP